MVAIATIQYRATILQSYTMATLPNAATEPPGQTYLVTDEATGPVEVYCDDNNWHRVTDNELARSLPLVIIINGQSNAAAGPPAPTRGASPMTKHLGPDILAFSQTSQIFVQAVDGSANAKTTVAVPSSTTGPGLGQVGALLCRRIAERFNQTVRAYTLAYTAQGIDYFRPGSVTLAHFDDGTDHGTLNNYNLLKSYKDVTGIIPQAYIWIQGEANAGSTQLDYYTKLKEIFDQSRIDYPGIKWYIVGTIGNLSDRIGAAGGKATPVRAAQKQLCDENPGDCFFVDMTDLMGTHQAYHGADAGVHYTTYAGNEEVAERLYAAIAGLPKRATPVAAPHILNVAAWTEFFYANKTIAAGDISQWQSDVPPNTTVMVPHNAKAPLNITFDDKAGGRGALEFDRDNAETLKKTGLTAANNWTIFAVMKADVGQPVQYLFLVTDAASGNRAAQGWFGQSLQVEAFYDTTSVIYDGGGLGFSSDLVAIHSFCWTLDTTNLLMKLYIDGELFGQSTIDGSEVNMTEVWLASFLATSPFEGRAYAFGYIRNGIATAQQATDMHKWVKAEFKQAA